MSETNNIDLLNELAQELQANPPKSSQPQRSLQIQPVKNINDEDSIKEYLNGSIQTNINASTALIIRLINDIQDEPEKIDALASLLKSNKDLLGLLNTQLLKQKEIAVKLKLGEMKLGSHQIKERVENAKSVVCSRNEAFKAMLNEAEESDFEILDQE